MPPRTDRRTASTAEMGYYPVLLDLEGRRCVMVGGGIIAGRRVDGLLTAGARVTVISPRLTRTLAARAAEGRIDHEAREYRDGDLDGADLAFVATDAGEVNAAVAREARARGVWINAADDPARCTFILPALVRRGDLTVAIATGGSSPALARAIREELETYLTDDYATLAAIAAEARREVRAAGRPVTADAWRRALGPEVRRLIVERGRDDAKQRLLELLGVES
jgi:precorrin-2 dehydrogenase